MMITPILDEPFSCWMNWCVWASVIEPSSGYINAGNILLTAQIVIRLYESTAHIVNEYAGVS